MTNVKKPAIANSSVIPSGGNSEVIASCVPKNKQDNGRFFTKRQQKALNNCLYSRQFSYARLNKMFLNKSLQFYFRSS
jgi:hypothetical protein